MRLVTFSTGTSADTAIGLVVGDVVVDLRAALAGQVDVPGSMIEFIRAGRELHGQVLAATAGRVDWPAGTTFPLAEVTLRAPLRPGKVVGVGLNYVEHVEESSRTLDTDKDLPTRPVLFSKPMVATPGSPLSKLLY